MPVFGEPKKSIPAIENDKITDIYFGKKVLTPAFENTPEIVSAKKGDTEKTIKAKFIKTNKLKKEAITGYEPEKPFKIAVGGEKITITYRKKVADTVSYEKINNTKVKQKVWVVAVCNIFTLEGKLCVEIMEHKQTNAELVYDNPVKFLLSDQEKTKLDFDLVKDKTVEPNIFAKEIQLQPKSKEDIKTLIDKFAKRKDKNAFLYIKGTITDTQKVTFSSFLPNQKENIEYLNNDGGRLEISGAPCFCNRDIKLDEMKSIVSSMRQNEGITSKSLFSQENCPLPETDKTYERLVEELNNTMRKFNINTCIRKIHFLAQSYHESSRYGTTLEFASGKGYDPEEHGDAKKMENTIIGDGPRYKGRGIIQLTWRKNHKEYLKYVLGKEPKLLNNQKIDELVDRGATFKEKYIYMADKLDGKGNKVINPKTKKVVKEKKVDLIDVDSASLIASNLHFAFDSAGWYWENLGHVTATNENINLVADKDDVLKVSQCINGKVSRNKLNGLTEREEFTQGLKELFNYDDSCINRK